MTCLKVLKIIDTLRDWQELDGMADDMTEALRSAKDKQKVKDLLREHVTNFENYRRQKEQQLGMHNAKLQEKLSKAGVTMPTFNNT